MLRMLRLMLLAMVLTTIGRLRRGPLLPSWPFGFELVIAFMRLDWRDLWKWPPAKLRRYLERLPAPAGDVRDVKRSLFSLGGVPAQRFEPPGAGDALLLYLHGGSYQFGSTKTHGPLIARLAKRAGVNAVGLDYRLAPEHPYPAALEDTLAAYEALLAQGTPAERIVVGGDSAGGNLTLALCLRLAELGRPLPGGALLLSPWLDLESTRGSVAVNAPYDYGRREMLLAQARVFAGGLPPSDPRLSLIHHPVRALPPTLVVVGTAELLLDECTEWVEQLRRQRLPVTLELLQELPHNGLLFPDQIPEADRGLRRAAEFIKAPGQFAPA